MVQRYAKQAGVASVLALGALLTSLTAVGVYAQMGKPEMVTVSGRLFDLTCGAKGHAMMNKWVNAENQNHMMPDGKEQKDCATMCLKGGQPAALFNMKSQKIEAVFACNPKATLANFAAENVEVQGFWAAKNKEGLSTFVPEKIRKTGGGSWTDVDCATMHS